MQVGKLARKGRAWGKGKGDRAHKAKRGVSWGVKSGFWEKRQGAGRMGKKKTRSKRKDQNNNEAPIEEEPKPTTSPMAERMVLRRKRRT